METETPVGINPRVDCVFKQILQEPDLLLDFLGAVLSPTIPIVSVEVLNPSLRPERVTDRQLVLDVRAADASGRQYQIEMQTWNETALKPRILHTWAKLYSQQLEAGKRYQSLRPAISIWLLNQNAFRRTPRFHHRFTLSDEHNLSLTDHCQIHALELQRWRTLHPSSTPTPLRGWLDFFSGAEA